MIVIKSVLRLAGRLSRLQVLEHVFLFLGIRTQNVALVHFRYKASRKYKNKFTKKRQLSQQNYFHQFPPTPKTNLSCQPTCFFCFPDWMK